MRTKTNVARKKFIKKQLKRVGCYAGPIDDRWTTPAIRTSIQNFVKYAKLSSSPADPDVEFLDVIRRKPDRVCPLEREQSAGRPGKTDDPGKSENSGQPKTSSRNASLGDPLKESLQVMPAGTIRTGQTVTFTARNGRKITCTGGNNSHQNHVPRTCFWN